jgi:hypothetical protein
MLDQHSVNCFPTRMKGFSDVIGLPEDHGHDGAADTVQLIGRQIEFPRRAAHAAEGASIFGKRPIIDIRIWVCPSRVLADNSQRSHRAPG